jgi:hypothetical protein
MKILMTNNTLRHLGGTETYTYALAVQLTKMGHSVTCYSPDLGQVADRLKQEGISVVSDLTDAPGSIDMIHAHHHDPALVAQSHYPQTPLIFTSHGVLPWQEQPPVGMNVHKYVAVSEEVLGQLRRLSDDCTIIRNGIDPARFSSHTPISPDVLRRILASNYMKPDMKTLIQKAADGIGADVRFIGGTQANWHIESHIEWADLVIGLGRTALEAMAMKRAVLVYDYNGSDGMVTPHSFDILQVRNFSGRTYGGQYTRPLLKRELLRYNPADPPVLHERIFIEHAIETAAESYVKLYEEAVELGRETTFGKIIQAIEQAEQSQAPVQKLADRLAGYLVYCALAAAVVTFLVTRDLRSTISVVIVAGACGVAVGTPLAIFAAISRAARQRAIVKGGRYMEALGTVDTVVLDKTGTVTFGMAQECSDPSELLVGEQFGREFIVKDEHQFGRHRAWLRTRDYDSQIRRDFPGVFQDDSHRFFTGGSKIIRETPR